MSEIKIPKLCEEHKKKLYIICLDKNCKKRFLCGKCFSTHEQSHSKNYLPINEFIDENNKIILFDDYLNDNNEKSSKLINLKEETIKEINKTLDEIKITIAKKINEIIPEYEIIEHLKNKNNLSFDELINLYNIINKENTKEKKENEILQTSKILELLKKRLNNNFQKIVQNLGRGFENFCTSSKIKQIEKAVLITNLKQNYGRILVDSFSKKVYCYTGLNTNQIDLYNNMDDLKVNKMANTITLSTYISGTYSVLHNELFYFFEFNSNPTNKLIKYDLNQNKIIASKVILNDALLGNSTNCWGGYNDIILISNNYKLYAVYSSNNNNKRISIALIDENNLEVLKVWNTDSLEKKQCGPIFMINNKLYHIKTFNTENDPVVYSYDLYTEKSENINIPFENKGGYDTSLTYYPHLNCLMTCNNSYIYKYDVIPEQTD